MALVAMWATTVFFSVPHESLWVYAESMLCGAVAHALGADTDTDFLHMYMYYGNCRFPLLGHS